MASLVWFFELLASARRSPTLEDSCPFNGTQLNSLKSHPKPFFFFGGSFSFCFFFVMLLLMFQCCCGFFVGGASSCSSSWSSLHHFVCWKCEDEARFENKLWCWLFQWCDSIRFIGLHLCLVWRISDLLVLMETSKTNHSTSSHMKIGHTTNCQEFLHVQWSHLASESQWNPLFDLVFCDQSVKKNRGITGNCFTLTGTFLASCVVTWIFFSTGKIGKMCSGNLLNLLFSIQAYERTSHQEMYNLDQQLWNFFLFFCKFPLQVTLLLSQSCGCGWNPTNVHSAPLIAPSFVDGFVATIVNGIPFVNKCHQWQLVNSFFFFCHESCIFFFMDLVFALVTEAFSFFLGWTSPFSTSQLQFHSCLHVQFVAQWNPKQHYFLNAVITAVDGGCWIWSKRCKNSGIDQIKMFCPLCIISSSKSIKNLSKFHSSWWLLHLFSENWWMPKPMEICNCTLW